MYLYGMCLYGFGNEIITNIITRTQNNIFTVFIIFLVSVCFAIVASAMITNQQSKNPILNSNDRKYKLIH